MKLKNLKNEEINLEEITSELNKIDDWGFNQSDAFFINKKVEDGQIHLPARLYVEDLKKTGGDVGIDISIFTAVNPLFYKTGEILELTEFLDINKTTGFYPDLHESDFTLHMYDNVNKVDSDDVKKLIDTQTDLFKTQYDILDNAIIDINNVVSGIYGYMHFSLSGNDFKVLSNKLRQYVDTGSSGKEWADMKGKSFSFLGDMAKLSDAIVLHEHNMYEDAPSPTIELFETKIATLNGMYKKE